MLSLKEDLIREMHKHVSLESPAILSLLIFFLVDVGVTHWYGEFDSTH